MQLSRARTFNLNLVRPLRTAPAPTTGRAYGTWLLVLGMIVVMLAQLSSGIRGYQAMMDRYGLDASAWSWGDAPDYGHLLSYAFLHGGSGHFFWNTLLLLLVGCVIEWRLGFKVVAGLFIAGALACGLTHLLVFPEESRALVGASGAVSALFGAAVVVAGDIGLRLRVPGTGRWFSLTLRRLLLFWVGQQFFALIYFVMLGSSAVGVAYWGHIAGFLVGTAGTLALRRAGMAETRAAQDNDFAPVFSGAGD